MNSANVNLNIRMDRELKNNLDALCNELGLTVSAAINIYAKAMVRCGGIPFDVRIDMPNKETLQAMKNAEDEKNLSRRFHSVKELMEDLNA